MKEIVAFALHAEPDGIAEVPKDDLQRVDASCPCQKCWRYITCHRYSTRVGSSPMSRCDMSSMAPTMLRVYHSNVACPLSNEAGLIRDYIDKDPVSHSGMADEGFDGGDFDGRKGQAFEPLIKRSSATDPSNMGWCRFETL